MPHNLAGWLSYLKQVAPGMEMTGWLVLLAAIVLFVLLIPYAWRAAMRHHNEALEREHAAATDEDAVGVVATVTDEETVDACVKVVGR